MVFVEFGKYRLMVGGTASTALIYAVLKLAATTETGGVLGPSTCGEEVPTYDRRFGNDRRLNEEGEGGEGGDDNRHNPGEGRKGNANHRTRFYETNPAGRATGNESVRCHQGDDCFGEGINQNGNDRG